jgi:hypothetical protein
VDWLLLVSTLPGQIGALRIRSWRALKALGAAALRDGVYLLPDRPDLATALEMLRQDVTETGGSARLLHFAGGRRDDDHELRSLFDRSVEFALIAAAAEEAQRELPYRTESEARRSLRRLSRNFESLAGIDYFESRERAQTAIALKKLEGALVAQFSPGEPNAIEASIPHLDRKAFKNKYWATRARPWIDRLACAWLIRRFIDPKAKFMWLDEPAACPSYVVGFDFDGAQFTHVGSRTTFEVMLVAFNLTGDSSLARLGSIVHALDLGGGAAAPEAAGLEALLTGLRDRYVEDDRFVQVAGETFDALYSAFKGTLLHERELVK